jgi:hypothetical protein
VTETSTASAPAVPLIFFSISKYFSFASFVCWRSLETNGILGFPIFRLCQKRDIPTLAPIAAAVGWLGPPVMSCNLCLAWRAVVALDRQEPRAATLEPWLRGEGWVDRLNARRTD